jgi:hypothetical protein
VPLISSITSNPHRAERFSKSTSSYRLTVLNNPRKLSGLPRGSKRRRAAFKTSSPRSKRLRLGRPVFLARSRS